MNKEEAKEIFPDKDCIDVKDRLLNDGPLRSAIKCSMCDKGAVWIPKIELFCGHDWPFYCEDHCPWRDDIKEDESVTD